MTIINKYLVVLAALLGSAVLSSHGVAQVAAKCPLGYGSGTDGKEHIGAHPKVQQREPVYTGPETPYDIFNCSASRTAISTLSSIQTQTMYESVVNDVIALYDSKSNETEARWMASCAIRLAGHDLLDY